jgi:hypothetical protein
VTCSPSTGAVSFTLSGNCAAASSVAPLNCFGSRPVTSFMTMWKDIARFAD